MKVTIKFPGALKHKGIDYDDVIESEDDTTLAEFLGSLNLNAEEIKEVVVIVNGKLANKKLTLKEGDEIIILSPIAGG